ncbi:F1F0 ATP synthase subunit e TDEL_0E02670 [Torulaspora delbrueckii]|uniref:ATP synthase F(0) complex subunit e, mitochondrial n=1 Tax=Torulaspora delbrueckii TaxID=4950 RepID=G8ZV66_TORDE|nr:hypothetical protein TDEL_0E02670 [Torulaspora delbrueckii]CCE92510.1 hypothetical protein TDEL_0E02670 [Torulaspora delbrueckii]
MSTVNVLRYSALGLGLFFGLKNDLSFKTAASKKEEQNAFDAKMKLVEEAKAEYAKLQAPVQKKAEVGSTKEVNFEDPNVDFAAVILQAVDSIKS